MPLDPGNLGPLLRARRLRAQLSQPEAARRAGVSTRLWSETERGERPHVSATTLLRMLAKVGVVLEPRDITPPGGGIVAGPLPGTEDELAALREDLRRAVAYGVDLSLIRASLDKTPLQRIRENDEALAFFDSLTITPGWPAAEPPRTRKPAARPPAPRRNRAR